MSILFLMAAKEKQRRRPKRQPLVDIYYDSHKRGIQIAVVVFVVLMFMLMAVWYFLPPLEVEEETLTSVRRQLGPNPLTIEVVYANGTQPSLSSLAVLEDRIRTYSVDGDNRSIAFTFETFEPDKDVYYSRNLRDLEDEHRVYFNDDNKSALFVLYLNGRFSISNAVGFAYDDSSFAIFQENIIDYLGSTSIPVSLHSYEASILVHEWGHIIGLVNIGYTSNVPGRHDDAHPHHSTSPKSVIPCSSVMDPGNT